MSLIKLKQIDDMRNKILTYKLLTEKTIFINSTKTANIIDKVKFIFKFGVLLKKESLLKRYSIYVFEPICTSNLLRPGWSNRNLSLLKDEEIKLKL